MREDLIERMRLLERDHDPDGWPAVRMRDITSLLDALEAAREDAERYRWLRDGGLGYLPYDDHGCGPEYPHHEDLDAAIDQARGIVPEAGQGVGGG